MDCGQSLPDVEAEEALTIAGFLVDAAGLGQAWYPQAYDEPVGRETISCVHPSAEKQKQKDIDEIVLIETERDPDTIVVPRVRTDAEKQATRQAFQNWVNYRHQTRPEGLSENVS